MHPALPSPPSSPSVLGPFTLAHEIAAGGMGRILAAVGPDGSAVAIKVPRAPFTAAVMARFAREARLTATLAQSSRHVVAVRAIDLRGPTPYFAMEALRGRDLAERLDADGPLPVRDVVDAMIAACDALAHAHRLGVVHRDVKPANLFEHQGERGERVIKLLDFGVAKWLDDDGNDGERDLDDHLDFPARRALTTSRAGFLGSPSFMSPEHVCDARRVDPRSDLWSLGATAYQLLTGTLPFGGESLGEVFAAVAMGRCASLVSLRPDVPAALAEVVMRCLARDPARRFATASALARELLAFSSADQRAFVDAMPREVASFPCPTLSRVARSELTRLTARNGTPTLTVPPPMDTQGLESTHVYPRARRFARLRATFAAVFATLALVGCASGDPSALAPEDDPVAHDATGAASGSATAAHPAPAGATRAPDAGNLADGGANLTPSPTPDAGADVAPAPAPTTTSPPPPPACGGSGQPCCAGSACSAGYACGGGTCRVASPGSCSAVCPEQVMPEAQCAAIVTNGCSPGWTPVLAGQCNWIGPKNTYPNLCSSKACQDPRCNVQVPAANLTCTCQ